MIDHAALNVWRRYIGQHRLAAALLASFVATHMATVSGYWYKIIGIPVLGWPQFNGILLLGHPGSSTNGTDQFWAGTVYHYGTGICYGLIFAFLIHPVLKIRSTIVGNLTKALLWAGLLGLLSALLWVPRNFPEFDPGFFTNNLGWRLVLGIFIWHAVYGLHLGALYNPLPAAEEAAAAEEAGVPVRTPV